MPVCRNVLLRGTGGALGRGCTAKISDFGLAIKLSENSTHIDNIFQVRGQGRGGTPAGALSDALLVLHEQLWQPHRFCSLCIPVMHLLLCYVVCGLPPSTPCRAP
jgi:hypothetical protein